MTFFNFIVIDHTVNFQKKVQFDEEKELNDFSSRNQECLEPSDATINHAVGSTTSSGNFKCEKYSRRQSDIVGCSQGLNIEHGSDVKLRGFSWDG